jgi:alpha-beta hydrolase superfamily lysophospholipase
MTAKPSEFTTFDGSVLIVQKWIPNEIKACVVIIHGLGEHSGRYEHIASQMMDNNCLVVAFDGRGHGKSDLPKPTAYIKNYKDYLKDIHEVMLRVKAEYQELPFFMIGHSMGGGMLAAYLLTYNPEVTGVILASSLLKIGEEVSKGLIFMSGILSGFIPKLPTIKVDVSKLSHDQEVVLQYQNDPLVYHSGVPARTGNELLKMMKFIELHVNKFSFPVLMIHGTRDMITPVNGTEQFFSKISSKDKACRLYPGLYHELFNETSKEEVLKDVMDWIKDRIK